MKLRKVLLITFILIYLMLSVMTRAQKTTIYIQRETVGMTPQGPIRQTSDFTLTITVTWKENGNIELSDGTVWRYEGEATGGGTRYSYFGTNSNLSMPNTRYIDLIMSANQSTMSVNYIFDTPGMCQQMTTYYTSTDYSQTPRTNPSAGNNPPPSFPGNTIMPPPVYPNTTFPSIPTPTYPTYPVDPVFPAYPTSPVYPIF